MWLLSGCEVFALSPGLSGMVNPHGEKIVAAGEPFGGYGGTIMQHYGISADHYARLNVCWLGYTGDDCSPLIEITQERDT